MIFQVFCVYDNKAEFFLPPFMTPTRAQAVRMLNDECARPDSQLARHPEDFTVYAIAVWDDASGIYTMHPTFQLLGTGTAFLPKTNGSVIQLED